MTNNPKATPTRVPAGSDPSGIPSISNTKSSTTLAKIRHVDRDLEYLASLGPISPMPWEVPSNAMDPTHGAPNKHMTGPE